MQMLLQCCAWVLQKKLHMPDWKIFSAYDALPQALPQATSSLQKGFCLGHVRLYLQYTCRQNMATAGQFEDYMLASQSPSRSTIPKQGQGALSTHAHDHPKDITGRSHASHMDLTSTSACLKGSRCYSLRIGPWRDSMQTPRTLPCQPCIPSTHMEKGQQRSLLVSAGLRIPSVMCCSQM